jgi:hypothetical protein
MFSRATFRSISFATVTPSFVIVGDPNFLSRTDVAAHRAECDLDRVGQLVGQLVDAAQDGLPRVLAVYDLLCHNRVSRTLRVHRSSTAV